MNNTQNIIEAREGSTLSYSLKDDAQFYITGYKVLHNLKNNGVLRCNKVVRNGLATLNYDLSGYEPLSKVIFSLSPDDFIIVFHNLIDVILEVKENGFMQCENIQLSLDKIFVDRNVLEVHLIYLPMLCKRDESTFFFVEVTVNNLLRECIQNYSNIQSCELFEVLQKLQAKNYPIDYLKNLLVSRNGQRKQESYSSRETIYVDEKPRAVVLTGMKYQGFVIKTDLKEFIIGKYEQMSDFVIPNNTAISRRHCKIYVGTELLVEDLSSLNGTYVNGRRLEPGVRTIIKPNDVLKIADFELLVGRK